MNKSQLSEFLDKMGCCKIKIIRNASNPEMTEFYEFDRSEWKIPSHPKLEEMELFFAQIPVTFDRTRKNL